MAFIENLEEIKNESKKIDVGIVLDWIQPGKSKNIRGNELRSCCPVHGGDGTENFAVSLSTHDWFCHSHGCKGSNLIDLYAQSQKYDASKFYLAAEEFANQFSIPIKYKDEDKSKKYTPEDIKKCWDEAKPKGQDSYFSKKKLSLPPIARLGNNPSGYYSTLIPLKNIEGELKAILSLNAGGKFNYGNPKEAFACLGEINPTGDFYIGEGIATLQTAWEATNRGIPAISCGTWSNIEPVLSEIKTKYPKSRPIVLIDCDEGGKGLENAKMIAAKYPDATFRMPSFESFSNPNKEKRTDFNDIISKCGRSLGEVKVQLQCVFDPLETKTTDPEKESVNNAEAPKTDTGSKNNGNCTSAAEALSKIGLLERIKAKKSEYDKTGLEKISGLPTNYPKLDEMMDGLQGGHLIILAGRTGMGKTFVILNMIKNIAIEQQIPVALYSLEMSNAQVFYRLISLLTNIPAKKIKRGRITNEELKTVEKAIKKIDASPLYLSDEPSNSTLSNLSMNIQTLLKEEKAPKAIFIDHIGLVSCGSGFKDNRSTEMGKITMTLKITAKQYDIPIICLAQLNREADSKEPPKLSQLRESGNLEQDADIVLFVHRRDYYDKNDKPGQSEIIVAKNRDGEVGSVTCEYTKSSWLLNELLPIEESLKKAKTASHNY